MTTPKAKKPRSPTKLDCLLGENLRTIRLVKGVSQEKLAEKLGLSFQQIQKYEKGKNRLSVTRLLEISHLLKAPFETFFEGFPNDLQPLQNPFLTPENAKLFNLIDSLPTQEKKEIAEALIKALR